MAITLEQLNDRITALENKQVSLPYPLSYNDQEILRKWLKQDLSTAVFEVNWDNYFYYRTAFEGMPGDLVSCTGPFSGTLCPSSGVSPDGLVLNTENATTNDFADFEKSPLTDSGLSWGKPQKMRTGFRVPFITTQEAYLVRGSINLASPYFGFKIVNATLKGVVWDGALTETTIDIQDISADTSYVIEARYSPNDKVIFYVDGEEKKIITTGLPNPEYIFKNAFYNFHIKTTANVDRTLIISFFEYIQLK